MALSFSNLQRGLQFQTQIVGQRVHGGKPDVTSPVKKTHQRCVIDTGPSETTSGTGIYLWIQDIDGNGWKDILAAGKEGLHLFRSKGRKQ